MTAGTRRRSSGATVSFSTIDAMMRTSYGVRFFDFALRRSTLSHRRLNVAIWSSTSLTDGVYWLNSYVDGKRNPSIDRRAQFLRNSTGGFAFALARM